MIEKERRGKEKCKSNGMAGEEEEEMDAACLSWRTSSVDLLNDGIILGSL